MPEVSAFENQREMPRYSRAKSTALKRDPPPQPEDSLVRHLATDESLFLEGELKNSIYKVESGAICVTASRLGRPPIIVELVFPGNLIGLGFLECHIHNAKAVVESSVSCWPLSMLPGLVEQSDTGRQRQSDATEREFVYRRNSLVNSTLNSPLQRLAAFLVAMSRLNEIEGRDRNIISESLGCGIVADYLKMDLNMFGRALVELRRRELIEHTPPEGLRLCDREKLELLVSTA